MDLDALENIGDFVGGAASLSGWHAWPFRPIRTPTNLPKANGSYALQ
jgi:hypothetical protein